MQCIASHLQREHFELVRRDLVLLFCDRLHVRREVLPEHGDRQPRVLDLEAAPQGVHPFARIVEAQLAEERRLSRTRGTGQDRDFAATVPLDDVVQ